MGRIFSRRATLGDVEDTVPVALKRHGLAVALEIPACGSEVVECHLRFHEPKRDQPTRRVVDVDGQRVAWPTRLEPIVVAPVNLHELAETGPAVTRLVGASQALSSRCTMAISARWGDARLGRFATTRSEASKRSRGIISRWKSPRISTGSPRADVSSLSTRPRCRSKERSSTIRHCRLHSLRHGGTKRVIDRAEPRVEENRLRRYQEQPFGRAGQTAGEVLISPAGCDCLETCQRARAVP